MPFFSTKVAFFSFETTLPDEGHHDANESVSSSNLTNAYITRAGLQQYLRRLQYFVTERELDLLFTLMDWDRDGRINYSDFTTSVTPRILKMQQITRA
jgi:EF-hand domain pair